jgi:hypothetical protein
MLRELTAEIVHDINAILTAATILEETIEKRSPNVDKDGKPKSSRALGDAVGSAVERLLKINPTYSCGSWDD